MKKKICKNEFGLLSGTYSVLPILENVQLRQVNDSTSTGDKKKKVILCTHVDASNRNSRNRKENHNLTKEKKKQQNQINKGLRNEPIANQTKKKEKKRNRQQKKRNTKKKKETSKRDGKENIAKKKKRTQFSVSVRLCDT